MAPNLGQDGTVELLKTEFTAGDPDYHSIPPRYSVCVLLKGAERWMYKSYVFCEFHGVVTTLIIAIDIGDVHLKWMPYTHTIGRWRNVCIAQDQAMGRHSEKFELPDLNPRRGSDAMRLISHCVSDAKPEPVPREQRALISIFFVSHGQKNSNSRAIFWIYSRTRFRPAPVDNLCWGLV